MWNFKHWILYTGIYSNPQQNDSQISYGYYKNAKYKHALKFIT